MRSGAAEGTVVAVELVVVVMVIVVSVDVEVRVPGDLRDLPPVGDGGPWGAMGMENLLRCCPSEVEFQSNFTMVYGRYVYIYHDIYIYLLLFINHYKPTYN